MNHPRLATAQRRRRRRFLLNPSARWWGLAALWTALIMVAAAGGIASATPSETVLHSFGIGNDGSNPAAGVIADSRGNFYGTTASITVAFYSNF